jgi:hypothetical protein
MKRDGQAVVADLILGSHLEDGDEMVEGETVVVKPSQGNLRTFLGFFFIIQFRDEDQDDADIGESRLRGGVKSAREG